MSPTTPDLSFIRHIPASVMVLDRDLRYVAASDIYLETVGLRMEDLAGRFLFEAFPEVDERRQRLEESIRRALAGERNGIDRLAYAIPDPEDRSRMTEAWWRCQHNPLPDADGTINHVIQITENVSELVRAEEVKSAIAHEMQHRVSNLLSLVQIIARRTAAHAETMPEFLERFDERLQSMARTHAYLAGGNWNRMSIREMVARQLEHGHSELVGQIMVDGPEISLPAGEALMLSMAIHELTTNSLKHGALRDETGKLALTWSRKGRTGFYFDWTETVADAVEAPGRTGFGSMILDSIVPNQLGGTASREFAPEGLRYRITVEDKDARE
jgi:PAS domain S-box-containing protein